MPLGEVLTDQWTHPQAFAAYEEARSIVAPALTAAVQKGLGYLPEGGEVLEVGAGSGALRSYGGEVAQSFTWTESDQNPDFLDLPRSRPSDQLVVKLPDIPLAPGSLDAVVGLGVLDTMETEAVVETIGNAHEVLRDGGVLLHMMDLTPDIIAEIHNNEADGVFPLPYPTEGDLGLCYIDRTSIGREIQAAQIPPETANVLLSLIKDPETYIPLTTKTGILPHLGALAVETGLSVDQEPSWMKYFGDRLGSIAASQGFELVANDYIEEDALKVRGMMHPRFRKAEVVFRKFGGVGISKEPTILMPSFIKTIANLHVFAARKPEQQLITH